MDAPMNEQKIRDILSGRQGGPFAAALRAALAPAGAAWSALMRLRRAAYRGRILSSRPAGIPVICVGNVTTGGTGKTPMVAWVTKQLLRGGFTPAILTRGYKAASGRSDEAELLRQSLPESVAVVVDADRVAGAGQARSRGANVLVMDDGFQHRRLRRNLDIVLIDATNPFGFGKCLPRGLLREPLSALADAGAIVITRSDMVAPDVLARLRQTLSILAPRASLHEAVHAPTHLVGAAGATMPLESLLGRGVYAFCGIANPGSFFAMLRRAGAKVLGERPLADHVAYDVGEAQAISRAAATCGAEVLVATQKDAVKLSRASFTLPLWQLAVEMQVSSGAEELTGKILAVAKGQMPASM